MAELLPLSYRHLKRETVWKVFRFGKQVCSRCEMSGLLGTDGDPQRE